VFLTITPLAKKPYFGKKIAEAVWRRRIDLVFYKYSKPIINGLKALFWMVI
jgi:hypothetical protein